MYSSKKQSPCELRTPQGNAKIGEFYSDGSKHYLLMKIRKQIYSVPIDYLVSELTKYN